MSKARSAQVVPFLVALTLLTAAAWVGMASAQSGTPHATAEKKPKFEEFRKAVVHVTSHRPEGLGRGAGFFIDTKGTILTNAHVIGKATAVEVVTLDGRILNGRVLAEHADVDIAVVSVPIESPNWLPLAATVGSSDRDADVIAIGHPRGGAPWSTVKGVVSGLTVRDGTHYVQTDSALNQGNSGGPLIVMDCGLVIGIVSWKIITSEGVAFAISVNSIRKAVPQYLPTTPGNCRAPVVAAAPPQASERARARGGEQTPRVPQEPPTPETSPGLRPASGTVLARRANPAPGQGELTVSNHLRQDAVVTLKELGGSRDPYLVLFVRAGEKSLLMDIADGEYELQYTIGERWGGAEFREILGTFRLQQSLVFEALPIVVRGAQGARMARVPAEGWAVILKEVPVQPSAPPSRNAPRRK